MFDLSIILSTFFAVFLAELGDKTQLCAFAIGAGKPHAWFSVFLGSAIALVITSLIAALCGKFAGTYVSIKLLNMLSGVFFIVLGVFYIFKSIKGA